MVRIRLTRTGRKNLATHRIVVTSLREKRDSMAIEYLGYYLPHDKKIQINKERAEYWLSVGAQPSDTVRYLMVKEGILKPAKYKRVYNHKPGKKAQERKPKAESEAK